MSHLNGVTNSYFFYGYQIVLSHEVSKIMMSESED